MHDIAATLDRPAVAPVRRRRDAAAAVGLVVRPLAGIHELHLFVQLARALDDDIADDVTAGRRRPEQMWIATLDGRLVATAAWWTPSRDVDPQLLDLFDVDPELDRFTAIAVGERMLRTALGGVIGLGAAPPEYVRRLPAYWRHDAGERRGAEIRDAALRAVGAIPIGERLHFEWRPDAGIPEPGGRLTFRAITDQVELTDLRALMLDENTVAAHLGELEDSTGTSDSCRVAMDAAGDPVGYVIPGRTAHHAVIAEVGVLPAHRGRGYAHDLIAEGTRLLAATGATRVRASTDAGDSAMAHVLARAGYRAFEQSIGMRWPH